MRYISRIPQSSKSKTLDFSSKIQRNGTTNTNPMQQHSISVALLTLQGVAAWQLPHRALANSPQAQLPLNQGFNGNADVDVAGADTVAGLSTFANLPFVDCFSDEAARGQKYDIAVFGAPHDTVCPPNVVLPTSSFNLSPAR